MQKLGLNEIREKYLSFFESKGHLRMPSFSLIPHNDPSLLLINAGMAPLKPYFTGAEEPPCHRVTTCQKCIRTPDIDNVGKTSRHGTFFEMLGNFSFGDYFKKEAIPWAWEFLTEVMCIPKDRLYVTIYLDDDEAFKIWTEDVGVPADRIYRMGKEDNFWEHGTGPCGPCSEIHYDRGPEYGCGKPDCKVGCDCDRYMEVWNLVFTQFDRQEDGSYNKLPKPNIDTGMGLERLACVMQGVDNLFEVDTIRAILDKVCEMSGKKYGDDYDTDVSIRKITDHIRSTVMMVSDGVIPSNEARGYVLRRLLRGAARNGKKIGIEGPFLSKLAELVIELSGDAYPNLKENADYIKKTINTEEEKFDKTINQGLSLLKTYIDNHNNDGYILPGDVAFKLHDTFGFPYDLTKDILAENGLGIDTDGFKAAMKVQKETAKAAVKDRSSWANSGVTLPDNLPKTEFVGYDTLDAEGKVLFFADTEENGCAIVTDITSFYAESGGQEADIGVITGDSFEIKVDSVTKTDGKFIHHGTLESGSVKEGDTCKLSVDKKHRFATERNHSATHLLQKALQLVLGDQVHQSGSSVNADRLRFDFNHTTAVTKEELAKVEEIVNASIYEDLTVTTEVLPIEEARKLGAMALFGEKYGAEVRVVKMGDFSLEFCGGTHVKHTASIGLAKIVSEGGVSAGIRRIEMVTGNGAREYLLKKDEEIRAICDMVKATPDDVVNKVGNIQSELKSVKKELDTLKKSLSTGNTDDIIGNAVDVGGIKVVAARMDMLEGDGLRDAADGIRDKLDTGVVVLASANESKVSIVAMVTKDAVSKGAHAGNIIKKAAQMCGGGGGGRPDMAQAGGKDPSKVDDMLKAIPDIVKEVIG